MAHDELLRPTLHVEVLLRTNPAGPLVCVELCRAVTARLHSDYDSLVIGQGVDVDGFGGMRHEHLVSRVDIVDYTGPSHKDGPYELEHTELDVQAYMLKSEHVSDRRRSINQPDTAKLAEARVLELPNVSLNEEWSSLVFDDALPARLLRYLLRMISMLRQSGLNLSTFNWNRLCLLHGPPGSGKSTLCRALAQKLSIRLGNVFDRSLLVEINTNAMLSKFFGESGKLIGGMFERIHGMAENQSTFVCVVIDEIETIAGSRTRSTTGGECADGLRATNQLLTALDRIRNLPNVIVICTSNLIDAIDPAFLDRVDIKQLIPAPSPEAVYNIFRSCLNELVRSHLVDHTSITTLPSEQEPAIPPPPKRTKQSADSSPATSSSSSSPDSWSMITQTTIPTFSEMMLTGYDEPDLPSHRVWALAKRCHGLSGRTLRRLPILGLAMYTWGGKCSLSEAVSALGAAIEQELLVSNRVVGSGEVVKMEL